MPLLSGMPNATDEFAKKIVAAHNKRMKARDPDKMKEEIVVLEKALDQLLDTSKSIRNSVRDEEDDEDDFVSAAIEFMGQAVGAVLCACKERELALRELENESAL